MVSRHSRLWIDLLRYTGRADVDPCALLARRFGDEQPRRGAGRGARARSC